MKNNYNNIITENKLKKDKNKTEIINLFLKKFIDIILKIEKNEVV